MRRQKEKRLESEVLQTLIQLGASGWSQQLENPVEIETSRKTLLEVELD